MPGWRAEWLVWVLWMGCSHGWTPTLVKGWGAGRWTAASVQSKFSRENVVVFKRKRAARSYEVQEDWYSGSSRDKEYDPFSQFDGSGAEEVASEWTPPPLSPGGTLIDDSAAPSSPANIEELEIITEYQKLDSELGAMVTDVGGDTWGQTYPELERPQSPAVAAEEELVPLGAPRSNDTMPGNDTAYWNVLETDMDFSSDLLDDEGDGDGFAGDESESDDLDFLFQGVQERQEVELDDSIIYISSPRVQEALAKPGTVSTSISDPTCDRAFASAVTPRLASAVHDVLLRVGVELTFNADDYQDSEQAQELTIEQLALLKARDLHRATGLPAIAERSGWSIEASSIGGGGRGRTSAYEFNTVGDEVDKLVAQLSMFGDDDRLTTYCSAVAYVDGEHEFVERSEVDVSLCFAEPNKQMVSASFALDALVRRLIEILALSPLRIDDGIGTGAVDVPTRFTGSRDLKEAVLKHGKVLPNNILDVSVFMDSMVDVDLMYACAQELAGRFMKLRPSKILTVATTGLVIAIPMAQILQVPVVYARKQRSVVMSDSYIASYSSKNHGSNRELHVMKAHLEEDDRVLLVDDFLSSGSAQEALMRVVGMASATPIGVAVLLEKVWESGRIQLSGFDVQVESLVPITDVDNGQINIS